MSLKICLKSYWVVMISILLRNMFFFLNLYSKLYRNAFKIRLKYGMTSLLKVANIFHTHSHSSQSFTLFFAIGWTRIALALELLEGWVLNIMCSFKAWGSFPPLVTDGEDKIQNSKVFVAISCYCFPLYFLLWH